MSISRKSYDEIVDLFARGSTPEEVLAFRPSNEIQGRVCHLLARNQSNELTAEEALELERLGEIEHFMQLVKARAKLYIERAF